MKKLEYQESFGTIDDGNKNYIVVNEFHDESVRVFKEKFDALQRDSFPIIPIYIDSFGGQIYSLLAMVDIIENSNKPVATIAIGKAMSAGSLLLACGSKDLRFAGRHTTIMIHDASSGAFGKIGEMKNDIKHVEKLNDILYDLLSKKCGHKNKDYFKKCIKEQGNLDWYLNAEEAKSHGLIDHIGIPKFEYKFSIYYKNDYDTTQSKGQPKKSK